MQKCEIIILQNGLLVRRQTHELITFVKHLFGKTTVNRKISLTDIHFVKTEINMFDYIDLFNSKTYFSV